MARLRLRPLAAGAEFLGVAAPPDWSQVFSSEGKLELEIGCGIGAFAIAHCLRTPTVRYIAIEKRAKYAREAAHRAAKAGLSNLVVIEADALLELPRLFQDATISMLRLHFPDPWWKRSHAGRIVVRPETVALFFRLMAPGGEVDFRTDVEARATEMLKSLEAGGFTNPAGSRGFVQRMPDELPTARERRLLLTGTPIFRARLKRPLAVFAKAPAVATFRQDGT